MKKYCVYCGKENNVKAKKCFSCGKKLNAKDHLVKEYVIKHIIDDESGKAFDKLGDLVKAFVKKYLYGMCFTVSVVVTTTSLAVHAMVETNQDSLYQTVTSSPSIASLSGYVAAFSSYPENSDGTYDNFVAFKEDGTFLRQRYSATEDYKVYQSYGTYKVEDNVDDGHNLAEKTIRFSVSNGRLTDDSLDIIDEQHLYYDPYNIAEVYDLVFIEDPRDWYRIDISKINIREADNIFGLE